MLKLYGLKSCDTCKTALRALDTAGLETIFVDIRNDADLTTLVPTWLASVGDRLINTRSTTWRGLSADEKALAQRATATLLVRNPTLIKRPVIEAANTILVGWTPETRAALGIA